MDLCILVYYQYREGIPTEYQTIASELRTKVKQVRQQYIPPRNRKTLKGNVAVAKLKILSNPNQSYSFEATSQRKPINIPGEEEGPPLWFYPRLDKALLGECYNKAHAEYKLFNAIAETIKQSNLPDDVTELSTSIPKGTPVRAVTQLEMNLILNFPILE